jgi:MFS family permease
MSKPGSSQFDRRWWILVVIGLAQLMVVLDATVVNVALPSAQRALHFSNDNRQWVVTAYALAFGSLLLLGGRMGDLFGRKWTLIGGLIGFSIASGIGGAAGSFPMLVGARAAQGAFGAVLAPSALALLSTTFENIDERRKAFGVFGAIAGAGAAAGLFIGGVLTQVFSWRLTLFVNLAIALPAALAALWLLVNERGGERPALDLPGTAAVSLGLFALVYGFSDAETHSWSDPITIIMLIASAVLLATFVALESRARIRCCHCGSSPTARAVARISRSGSPPRRCSARSCSSPTSCRTPRGTRRSRPGWRSCRCPPWSSRPRSPSKTCSSNGSGHDL